MRSRGKSAQKRAVVGAHAAHKHVAIICKISRMNDAHTEQHIYTDTASIHVYVYMDCGSDAYACKRLDALYYSIYSH